MASLNFTQPFSLEVPDAALTTSNGEAAIVLTPATLGAIADGDAVLNADVQMFGPVVMDLIDTATGFTRSFIPRFAGTLTIVDMVSDGATTATGTSAVEVTIGGAAVTLSGLVRFTDGTVSGTTSNATVTAGGDFAAGQVIRVTATNANTAATFGGVTLGYTRTGA